VKNFKIKSYCKINLFLKVLKKTNKGYHKLISLITFCDLHNTIFISNSPDRRDHISFFGQFKKGISLKKNSLIKVLDLLRKNGLINKQSFKIKVKKNIPHGSGLGGGSSNAAVLLNFFNRKLKLKKNKIKKLAAQIGFDVPISLERKNTFLTGENNQILRLKRKFNLNLLIVYPNLPCSTKIIFNKNKTINKTKPMSFFHIINNKKLVNFLIKENNDLEKTVTKIYPEIKKIIIYIKSQKGCYFSRITGSGSACIGIFSNTKNAMYAKKLIKLKYPKYWCAVSKTI